MESGLPAARVVVERDSPSDGVLARFQMLILPYPPNSVDLGVMKEEIRVTQLKLGEMV